MQTLAMGCQLALSGRLAPARALIALARLPFQPLLPLLLDAPFGLVVVGIGSTPLPLHPALQPTDGLGVRGELLTEHGKTGFRFSRNEGDRRGAQVRSDGIATHGVLLLAMWDPLTGQLHKVAVSLAIGPLSTRTGSRTPDETGIFDVVSESMGDHLIVPIDHGRHLVILPDQPAAIALLWRLEHKAQAGIVALVLEASKASATTLKAHPTGLAHTDAVEGVIGTAGQRLGQHRIQVLGQPRDA